jgi:hypothetical protein
MSPNVMLRRRSAQRYVAMLPSCMNREPGVMLLYDGGTATTALPLPRADSVSAAMAGARDAVAATALSAYVVIAYVVVASALITAGAAVCAAPLCYAP